MVCVADDLFQSSRPGDFDVTPTTVSGCSTYSLCSTLPLPTGRTMLQSYIVFNYLFQPSPMLLLSVLLTIYPVQSSPVQRLFDGQQHHQQQNNTCTTSLT